MAAALLAGDAVQALAVQALLDSAFEPAVRLSALAILNEAVFTTVGGELIDVFLPLGLADLPADAERIQAVTTYKTAVYSFATPLRLGWSVAGRPENDEAILRFSVAAGTAFQMSDDLLGMFGNEQEVGKPTDSDIKEGKRSYLWLQAENLLKGSELKRFRTLYGKQSAEDAEVAEVRELLEVRGVRGAAQDAVDQQLSKALSCIPDLKMLPEAEKALAVLLEKISRRIT
jgi:geranylgeranyl diphosphate synthase type II